MIVGSDVKTLWKVHAAIIVDPPEVAVVRHLARFRANESVKRLPVNDVVVANLTVTQSHSPARVLNLGPNCQGKEENSQHGHSWGF